MRIVIYTVITGGYDGVIQPVELTPDADYVIYTDNDGIDTGVWEKRPIPEAAKNLDKKKQSRYPKIMAHEMFPDYDVSVYVDGSVKILKNLAPFINKLMEFENKCVFIPQHPARKCIYDEAGAVISLKKDTKDNVDPEIKFLKSEGFPAKYGLSENNIIIRRHNDERCVRLMERWWSMVLKYSHRDQLSLFYSIWKENLMDCFRYLSSRTSSSEHFKWMSFHKGSKIKAANKIGSFLHNG